jgi:hypothetical protein
MAQLPNLKTGAVVQYPVTRAVEYPVRVLRFADGTTQRIVQGPRRRRWLVRYDQLDALELHMVVEFLRARETQNDTFEFADPESGTTYARCRLLEWDVWEHDRENTGAAIRFEQEPE